MPRWDEEFAYSSGGKESARVMRCSGLRTPASVVERRTYKKLADIGFRFEDLVKYNDHHAEDGPASAVLQRVTWSQPDQFFGLVEKAYRKFYLRPKFVSDFKQLVAAGY